MVYLVMVYPDVEEHKETTARQSIVRLRVWYHLIQGIHVLVDAVPFNVACNRTRTG